MSQKKSILNWLEEQSNEEKEVVIKWDGGGDSGWVYCEVDGDDTTNEYTEALVRYMENHLDYGSWAGEFTSSGTAYYNAKTKTFEGIDYYGEDQSDVIDTDIQIAVPKALWFETLHVECERNYDETTNVSVRLILKNGFLTNGHEQFCNTQQEDLQQTFDALFDNYSNPDGSEFRYCSDSWILDRSEAKEEDDMLVFTINKIDVSITANDERDVVFRLDDDIVESIDESLNSKEHAD